MYALNFYQNGKQVNQDAGHDKFVRLDLLIVRERLQLASAWVGGIVMGKRQYCPDVDRIHMYIYLPHCLCSR
jgi:hypothetical protein